MKEYIVLKIGEKNIRLFLPCLLIIIYLSRRPFLTFGKFFNITAPIAAVFLFSFIAVFVFYTITCRKVSADGIVLVLAFGAFFAITLYLHPEYMPRFVDVYKDGAHSAKNVFALWSGIYCYYLFRLAKGKDEELFLAIKAVAYAIMLFEVWGFFNPDLEYNMGFGYRMEFAAIVFLADYLWRKSNAINVFFSLFCFGMSILYGSRASIFGYVVFVLVYMIWEHKLNKRKTIILSLFMAVGVLYTSETAMIGIYNFFANKGMVSRTLYRIAIGGNFSDSSGRTTTIWPVIIEAIKDMPIYKMYGAFGDRMLLSPNVPYAHNFILEIIMTFGIVLGTVILIWMIVSLVRIVINDKSVTGLLTIIFATFSLSRLFFSSSFWIEHYFWAMLAMIVNYITKNKLSDRRAVQA